jgi:hypothetical protein
MILRTLAAGFLVAVMIGAACPREEERRRPPADVWHEEIFLRVGDSAEVDGGSLLMAMPVYEPGDRVAFVTIELKNASGEEVRERIKVVRQTDLSTAVRLAPYVARVIGFPGADSARFLVYRE